MQQLRSSPTLCPSKKNQSPISLSNPLISLSFHHKWRIFILLFLFLFFLFLLLFFFIPMSSPHSYFANLGLGYSIAIALAFLVLLSTLILSSYLCCRTNRHNFNNQTATNNNNTATNTSDGGGIVLPRVIFVAEDDGDEENTAVGLDQNVINSYPRFQFSRGDSSVGQSTTCSICLCEYKDSEMLRMMPECRHYFHLCCLDSWLKLKGSCPVCRNSPLPTPLSTPLSTPLQEVVPLSQYAADRRRR